MRLVKKYSKNLAVKYKLSNNTDELNPKIVGLKNSFRNPLHKANIKTSSNLPDRKYEKSKTIYIILIDEKGKTKKETKPYCRAINKNPPKNIQSNRQNIYYSVITETIEILEKSIAGLISAR